MESRSMTTLESSWWSLHTSRIPLQIILTNFYYRNIDVKPLKLSVLLGFLRQERQEGGFPIDNDTGVILMESLDIQDNISGHSGQLSLKKYCCKTALTARSPRFSPSGTWASSTTSMGLGSTPTPSSWSSAMTWGLAVGSRSLASIILTQWSSEHCSFSAFYKGRMMISSKTALRGGTTGILTKPILMTSYTIYLSISIEKTVTRGDFQFDPFCE